MSSIASQALITRIGEVANRVGFGRTAARIYALLLMSERPRSLDDMARALRISRASASVEVRGLARLGAVRKVFAPGTRRDLYQAEGDLMNVLRQWAQTGLARRVEETAAVLAEAERFVEGLESSSGERMPQVRERLANARALHARLEGIVAMFSRLLANATESGK